LSPDYTVAGVQDGGFESFKRGLVSSIQYTSLCCTKLRQNILLDTCLQLITVDGVDSTSQLLECLQKWEVDFIIMGGATFAGFNVVDFTYIQEETNTPIIVFSLIYPDVEAIKKALIKHFEDWIDRWRMFESLGPINQVYVKSELPPIYYEVIGCPEIFAEKVLKDQALVSRVPEAVRVANLIAKGVTQAVQDL
jgi:endonuclease V-like protein UPF0215 family